MSGRRVWRYDAHGGRTAPACGRRSRAPSRTARAAGASAGPRRVADGTRQRSATRPRRARKSGSCEAALVIRLPSRRDDRGVRARSAASGRQFNREESSCSTTLAAQSAVAIQNAYSYRALQALNAALEDKVRSRERRSSRRPTPSWRAPTRAAGGAGPTAHHREDGIARVDRRRRGARDQQSPELHRR